MVDIPNLYRHLDLSVIFLGHVSLAPNSKAIFGFSHSPGMILGLKKLLARPTGLKITFSFDSISNRAET